MENERDKKAGKAYATPFDGKLCSEEFKEFLDNWSGVLDACAADKRPDAFGLKITETVDGYGESYSLKPKNSRSNRLTA